MKTIACGTCKQPLNPKTKWQKYCSPACRMTAWMKTHYGEKDSAPVPLPIGNMLLELIEKYNISFGPSIIRDTFVISVPEMGERGRALELEGKTYVEAIEKAHIEVTLLARKKEMEKVG
jgi:hypothetical protein